MRINTQKRRHPLRDNPLVGITLTVLEKGRADKTAKALLATGVTFRALALIRDALAARILELEAAARWTEPGTLKDQDRRDDWEEVVVLYRAYYLACERHDGD